MRKVSLLFISFLGLVAFYFTQREPAFIDKSSLYDEAEAETKPAVTEWVQPKEGPLKDAPPNLEAMQFSPPPQAGLKEGDIWVFPVPSGEKYKGNVTTVEPYGLSTTIVQGEVLAGGFFVFTYGPSAVFGSLSTPEGSFEYKGSLQQGRFLLPPEGKLEYDIAEP